MDGCKVMYCLLCNSYSFSLVCQGCREEFLTPKISKRILSNGLEVYSFYKYKYIEKLLLTKHKFIGYFVYNIMAKESFKKFADTFSLQKPIYSLGIDDNVKSGYSHTAILNKALKSNTIKPVFAKLRATNHVNYSGKTLSFREANPRKFQYFFKEKIETVLVDDIITTGTTLKEADILLQKYKANVLFALTLADARDN